MTVYILGSGFSQAAGEPLANEINLQLFKNEKSKDSFLYRWISEHLYYNHPSWHKNFSFEELISRLDLYLHYNHLKGDENNIKKVELELLHHFIDLLKKQNLNYNSSVYEKFIKKLNPDDTIVSFNYDLLIEKTLKNLNLPMPNFGIINTSNSFINNSPFNLYKLHGSINWSYCPRCKEIFFQDSDIVDEEINNLSAGNCIRKPLIIAPTLYKSYSLPKLRILWKKAFKVLSNTPTIYFIGYSIPRADALVYQLLDLANSINTNHPKVYLVNGNKANYTRHLSIYSSLINTNLTFEEWIKKE